MAKRRKGTFRKRGFPYTPLDKNIPRKAASRKNLLKGLKTLSEFWEKGLSPGDLKSHYFLTWLAYCNGNATQMSRKLGVHRNTVVFNFAVKLRRPSTRSLRKVWKSVAERKAGRPFSGKVFEFYCKVFGKPRFSRDQSAALTNLWMMGAPLQAIRSHFALWLIRSGQKGKDAAKAVGVSARTYHRYRVYARRHSSTRQWLGSLGLKKGEWTYPRGRRD